MYINHDGLLGILKYLLEFSKKIVDILCDKLHTQERLIDFIIAFVITGVRDNAILDFLESDKCEFGTF